MIYEIETLNQLMKKIQQEYKLNLIAYSKMPMGRLYQEKRGERIFYYRRLENRGYRTRKGITKDKKLVYQLARKEYLLGIINYQKNSMKWVDKIESKINFQRWQRIEADLTKKFPALNLNMFLQGEKYKTHKDFQSPMIPEGTIHRSLGGAMVRSKSELIIVDMLESMNIPYQYEAKLLFDSREYYPDFTLIRPRDGKTIYWEHFGMTHDENYLRKMDLKLKRYRSMGIKPWENLIVSYEQEDGSLDVLLIRALVQGWLL